jgi:alkylhydroperoxidase family enzyme
LPQSAAPDNVYEKLESVFSPEEIVELTFVIIAINSWNILGVGFRTDVGNCSSDSLRKSHS